MQVGSKAVAHSLNPQGPDVCLNVRSACACCRMLQRRALELLTAVSWAQD